MIGLSNLWPSPNKEFFRIIPNRMYQILIRMLFAPRISDHGKRRSKVAIHPAMQNTAGDVPPQSNAVHTRGCLCTQKVQNITGDVPASRK